MKRVMLAAVASIALSLPAMAQSNDTNAMQPNNQSQTSQSQTSSQPQHNQSQTGGNQQNGQARQQAENRINPSSLNKEQIRQIQMTLNKKGFDAKRVDGIWGPETEAALKDFQQQQHLQGSGHLTQQTLGALGVDVNGHMQQGSATTGSGSSESQTNRPSQNPGTMNHNNSNMNGQTNGQGTGQSSGSSANNPSQPNHETGSGSNTNSNPQ